MNDRYIVIEFRQSLWIEEQIFLVVSGERSAQISYRT